MSRFSTSPGSIYPALERLYARGWLKRVSATGRRGRARYDYTLAAKGTEALLEWLRRPLTLEEVRDDLAAVILRFTFMQGRLSSHEVACYLDELERLLVRCRNELIDYVGRLESMNATHAALGARNGVLSLEAHLTWLGEVRVTLAVTSD